MQVEMPGGEILECMIIALRTNESGSRRRTFRRTSLQDHEHRGVAAVPVFEGRQIRQWRSRRKRGGLAQHDASKPPPPKKFSPTTICSIPVAVWFGTACELFFVY
jgi:hypothetical protein